MTYDKVPVTVEHVVKGMLKAVQHGIIRDDDIVVLSTFSLRWDDKKKETAFVVFLLGKNDQTPYGRLYISADEYTWEPIESEENSDGKQKDQ